MNDLSNKALQNGASFAKHIVAAKKRRATCMAIGLFIALAAFFIISIGIGQLSISPLEVITILLNKVGINTGIDISHINAEAALLTVRVPRALMAVVVGAGLAAAGLVMQAIFANPLADPGIVGVSSGAALGACTSIVFGFSFFGSWTTPFVAFVCGLAVSLIIYACARSKGKTEIVTLILTGVAINAFAGAFLAFLTYVADTSTREEIVFWQLGSLNGTRWVYFNVAFPIILIGIALVFLFVRKLDILSLGDREAVYLGINVERLRMICILLVAVIVAASVCFVGIISFVGLVIPHLMRMILGPAHLPLLITSVIGGALLLEVADLIARTAIRYSDLPIGMLTSLAGGPFFFWLIIRTRRQAGGWG